MKFLLKYHRTIIIMIVLFMPLLALAQPGFGSDVNDSGAPLDGGLSALAVAGAGYGLKKVREARNKRKKTGDVGNETLVK